MYKKLIELLNGIREDHKKHLIVGVATGFPMVLLFGNIGGLIAICLYGLKELVYDKALGRGNMEFLDWLYSCIPVIQILIIYNLK
jgi:hypothetical protein